MASADAQRIADNLQRIREEIQGLGTGEGVRLVCVTKYASVAHVRMLLDAGAEELGENLLPDSADRFTALRADGYEFTRHLIGAQQSRKLKQIPGNFDMFQAVDRIKTARMLNQALAESDQSLDVLLQVNISREQQKSGFIPEEVDIAVADIRENCQQLCLRGLMAIPAGPDAYSNAAQFKRETASAFGQMRDMFDRISASFPAATPFDVLSQGMSQDYRLALAEGSNMIRIGSALFEGLEGK